MSIAAMIRRMGEAGATPEAIAIAVEEIEGIQGMLEARRHADRDRKRAQRERQKQADVTGHSEDSHGTVTDTPSLEVSPQTPLPKPNPVIAPLNPPKSRGRKALFVQVPEWMPAEEWVDFVAARKAMRNVPFEEGAARRVIAKIEKLRADGHCPAKLLSKAVMNGWRTVFENEDTKGYSGTGGGEWSAEKRAAYLARLEGGRRDSDGSGEAVETRSKAPPEATARA